MMWLERVQFRRRDFQRIKVAPHIQCCLHFADIAQHLYIRSHSVSDRNGREVNLDLLV